MKKSVFFIISCLLFAGNMIQVSGQNHLVKTKEYIMALRNFKSTLYTLFFAMLCSCNSLDHGHEMVQNSIGANIALCNRECNVLLFDNLRLVEIVPVANTDMYDRVYEPDIKDKGPISVDSLFILAGVFHKDYTDFRNDVFTDKGRTKNALMSERIPGDPSMEQQIKEYIISRREPRQKGLIGGGVTFAPIDTDFGDVTTYPLEYRTAGCTSITITSTKTLFGREAGSDISDMFELIPDSCGDYSVYLFNYDSKALLGKMGYDGMSIKDYLALRPTVLPICLYHMTQSPEEAPIETDITIDIGMADGKHVSATTHVSIKG